MSKQRVISESTGLYKLSIVNKQQQAEENPPRNDEAPLEPTRKGLPLTIPLESGHDSESSVDLSRSSTLDGQSKVSEALLYELAAKRRQVVELKQQLSQAERELSALEHKCRDLSQENKPQSQERLHEISSKFQKTLQDVNSSPRMIKSKQSISNFFNKDSAVDPLDSQPKLPPRLPSRPKPPVAPMKPSFLQATASKFQEIKSQQSQSPFFAKLMDKWQDFNVNEEEEAEFDDQRSTDQFYIKSKLDYDDDEEVPSEPDESEIFGYGGPTVSTYKRTGKPA